MESKSFWKEGLLSFFRQMLLIIFSAIAATKIGHQLVDPSSTAWQMAFTAMAGTLADAAIAAWGLFDRWAKHKLHMDHLDQIASLQAQIAVTPAVK